MSSSESDLKSPQTLQNAENLETSGDSTIPILELRGKDVPRPKNPKQSKIPKPLTANSTNNLVTPKSSILSGPTNESTRLETPKTSKIVTPATAKTTNSDTSAILAYLSEMREEHKNAERRAAYDNAKLTKELANMREQQKKEKAQREALEKKIEEINKLLGQMESVLEMKDPTSLKFIK